MNNSRSNLQALNLSLFEQLERLQDDSLSPEELDVELKRAAAVVAVSKQIVDAGRFGLEAKKHADEMGEDNILIPLLH